MRLAVWGLGHHAIGRVLPAVAQAQGVELYGVCSRSLITVAEHSTRWGCRGWSEPDAMLSDPLVDVVYVATPIGLHAQHGVAVLKAGKHLWCEKALTARLSDTRELLELSERRGLSVRECFMYLHHPQFLRLAEVVSHGELGRILAVSCRFGVPKLTDPGFRSDPNLGGGALFDIGSYPISAVQALFPDVPQTVLYASMSKRDGAVVDTDGQAWIALSNGAMATLEWRSNAAYRNEIDIWGERASLNTDKLFSKPASYAPQFRIRDAHGNETIESIGAGDHFVLMLESFSRLIDDEHSMRSERNNIARRAEALEQIVSMSSRPLTRAPRSETQLIDGDTGS